MRIIAKSRFRKSLDEHFSIHPSYLKDTELEAYYIEFEKNMPYANMAQEKHLEPVFNTNGELERYEYSYIFDIQNTSYDGILSFVYHEDGSSIVSFAVKKSEGIEVLLSDELTNKFDMKDFAKRSNEILQNYLINPLLFRM